jgi:small-conductance mechanosensitive channel
VDLQQILEWLNQQTPLGLTLAQILWIAVISIIAFLLERLITRYLRRFAKRARLERGVSNNLILTFRILILIGSIVSIVRVGGLDTQWFLAFSALGGAAVGFASTQTIGNFIAGLYLLAARPFKVGDYVRLGTVEGIVQEITINYTKILTIGNNVVSLINLQILQREITNYLYESGDATNLYCYTFEIGFDHSVSIEKTAEIFNQVFERYRHMLPKKPGYMLTRSGAFERVYMVYLYVRKPEEIFDLRPRIAEEVFNCWDKERSRKNP